MHRMDAGWLGLALKAIAGMGISGTILVSFAKLRSPWGQGSMVMTSKLKLQGAPNACSHLFPLSHRAAQ